MQDRKAFADTDQELAEAVREFLTMYEARVTVIYERLSAEHELYQQLLANGVGNLVCGTEIDEIQQELAECLSEEGMERHLPPEKRRRRKEWYRFDCSSIRIAVVSS